MLGFALCITRLWVPLCDRSHSAGSGRAGAACPQALAVGVCRQDGGRASGQGVGTVLGTKAASPGCLTELRGAARGAPCCQGTDRAPCSCVRQRPAALPRERLLPRPREAGAGRAGCPPASPPGAPGSLPTCSRFVPRAASEPELEPCPRPDADCGSRPLEAPPVTGCQQTPTLARSHTRTR